jgi:DNA-binding NtrC family response regulator
VSARPAAAGRARRAAKAEGEAARALVVDRETPETRRLLAFLRARGYRVLWAKDGESAFNVLDHEPVDCLVCELSEPRIDGIAVLHRAQAVNSELCAVMMTAGADIEAAVATMREGAYDFQTKPLNLEKLAVTLRHGLSHQELANRVADLESRLDERFGFERFTGNSPAIARVLEQIRQVAPTRAAVLITGEAGTGKEMAAQALHQNSPRAKERFVRVNFAGLAEDVVESELFGRAPGPGARRAGRFELADGGTLFLDEISAVGPAVQAKLLRVLQEQEFEPVGGAETRRADARVVAATDRDLEEMVREGRFREDLYRRLRVVAIHMPPLRERKEDVSLLVEQFLREFNRAHGRRVTGINRGALERLLACDWPGNVRELKNCVEGMVVFAEGKRPLAVADLPPARREFRAEAAREVRLDLGLGMEEVERRFIEETLRWVGYDKQRAAETLGIGLRTLYRKLKQYGIV